MVVYMYVTLLVKLILELCSFMLTMSSYLVRRYIAVLTVGLLSFSIGLGSALNVDIFVNQDAVWAHALIIGGCFLFFLVFRYGVLKFRRVLYNEVRSRLKLLILIITLSFPSILSMVLETGLYHISGCLWLCK